MIARTSLAAVVLALALGAGFTASPAQAERLIVSVSNHRVTVTPNYSGEELVLFGSVEKDASTPATRTSYDLVVTVSGPRADMVTRRKERKLGIWINTDSRVFLNVPAYLARLSNRPFGGISSPVGAVNINFCPFASVNESCSGLNDRLPLKVMAVTSSGDPMKQSVSGLPSFRFLKFRL